MPVFWRFYAIYKKTTVYDYYRQDKFDYINHAWDWLSKKKNVGKNVATDRV